MLPDLAFVAMAHDVGFPKREAVTALATRQRELAAQGRRVGLFDLARETGVLGAAETQWFEAFYTKNQAELAASMGSAPPPPAAPAPPAPVAPAPASPAPSPPDAAAELARSTRRRRSVASLRTTSERRAASLSGEGPGATSAQGGAPSWALGAGGALVAGALVVAVAIAGRSPPPAVATSSASAPRAPTSAPAPTSPAPASPAKRAQPSAAARAELVARANEAAVQVRGLVREGRLPLALARIDGLVDRLRDDPAADDALAELSELRAWVVETEAERSRAAPTPAPPTERVELRPQPRPSRPAPEPSVGETDPEPSEPRPAPARPTPRPTPAAKPAPTTPGTPTTAPLVLRGPALDPGYLARRARASEAEALLRLSRWAAGQDLFEEEKDALLQALQVDPGHTRSRRRLDELLAEEQKHTRFATPWRREAQVLFVETNTSQAWLHLYCDSVAAFWSRFSKVFRVPQDPVKVWGRKIGVKLFATRGDFDRYQRESGSQLGESAVGYYSFGDKELVLYHDPADVEETLTTLFHEGTHLFCHLALGERIHALPIWVLEGTAEYFGTARFDREAKDLEYGRVNHGRLLEARALLARPTTSLKGDLLAFTDYESFGAGRYALAWSLVHLLLEKRRPGSEKPVYRDRFAAYFDAVANGGDPVKSFESLVGPIAAVDEEWRAYVRDLPLSPLEEGRWHLAQGDAALALPLLEAHRRAAPKDAKGAYWLGEALVLAGRTEEAVVAWREAVDLEPHHTDALVSLAWGLILLDRYPDAVVVAQQAVKVRPSGEHQELLATAAVYARQKAVATAAVREAIALLGPSPERLKLKAEADALP